MEPDGTGLEGKTCIPFSFAQRARTCIFIQDPNILPKAGSQSTASKDSDWSNVLLKEF